VGCSSEFGNLVEEFRLGSRQVTVRPHLDLLGSSIHLLPDKGFQNISTDLVELCVQGYQRAADDGWRYCIHPPDQVVDLPDVLLVEFMLSRFPELITDWDGV
jgi:hypothetical protein